MTTPMNSNILRMLASAKGEAWAMSEDRVRALAAACLDAADKADAKAESDWLAMYFPMRQDMRVEEIDGKTVAIIPVQGGLVNKTARIYEELGLVTRYETIASNTNQAISQNVDRIVYLIDSPGGTVSGVAEASEAIERASDAVETVACCSNLTCSAAYWLASQANHIVATPSAEVGNIGAIISWADCTGFWQEMGIEFKALVSDGADLKSTFHLEPNETQLAFLQESINEAGAAFREAVTNGRGEAGAILDGVVWRAGWYSGNRALQLGLVDSIGTLDDALKKNIATGAVSSESRNKDEEQPASPTMFESRSQLKDKLAALESDHENLSTELSDARAQIETFQAELASARESVSALQESVASVTAERDDLQATAERLEDELAVEREKTTDEAINALVTAKLAEAGHPIIDIEKPEGDVKTAAQKYRELQSTDPRAAARFWDEHRDEILNS